MLKPPKPTAVIGPARRDASPAADDVIKLRQRIASLKGDNHDLPEPGSSTWQHSDDDRSSPVSVATPREDSAESNEPSKSLPRSDSTPHSLPTTVSYGDVIDELDMDLFHVRVREREELAPPEDTALVAAQLATLCSRATSKAAASSGDLPWHEAFDFLDRLRRVILHDLAGLARAYMGTTLANGRAAPTSSSSPSLSNSSNCTNASWEQQCLAAQVLPFVCGCLLDRRTSLSRNSVECLADVFVSAGSEHLKAVAVLEPAMSSLLDLLGGSGTKSLKEAASRALDTSVAYVPARHVLPAVVPFAVHKHKDVQAAALRLLHAGCERLRKLAASETAQNSSSSIGSSSSASSSSSPVNVAPAAAAMATLAPLLVPALAAGCNAKGAGAKTAARGCLQCLRQSLGAQRFKRAVDHCRDKSVTKAQLQVVLDASYSGPDSDAPLPPGFALLDICSPAALSRILAVEDAASPGVGSGRSPRSGNNGCISNGGGVKSKSGAGTVPLSSATVPASPSPRAASSNRGLGRISSAGNDRGYSVDRGRSLDRSTVGDERGLYRGAANVLSSPTAESSAGAAAAGGLPLERSQFWVGRFQRDKPSAAGAAMPSSAAAVAHDYGIAQRGRSAPRPASPTGAPPALPFEATGRSPGMSPAQAPSPAFPSTTASSSSFAATASTSAAAHKAAAALSRAKAAAGRERAASASSRLHPRDATPPPPHSAGTRTANSGSEAKNGAAAAATAHAEVSRRRGRASSASATSRLAAKGTGLAAGDSGGSSATADRSRRSAVPSYSDLLKSPGLPLRENLSVLNAPAGVTNASAASAPMSPADALPAEPSSSTPEATPPRKREQSMSTTPLPSPPALRVAPLSPLHEPPPLVLRPPVPQEAKPNPRQTPLDGGSDTLLTMAANAASSAGAASRETSDLQPTSSQVGGSAENATNDVGDAAVVNKEAEQLRSALEKGELAAWELPALVAECVAEGEFTPSQGDAILTQLDAHLPLSEHVTAPAETAEAEARAPLVLLEPPTGPLAGPPLIDPSSDPSNIWDIAERANSLSPPSLRAMRASSAADAPTATAAALERSKQLLSRSVSALPQSVESHHQSSSNNALDDDDDDHGVLTPEASDPNASAATSWLVRPLMPPELATEPISNSFDSGVGSSSSRSSSNNYGYDVQDEDSAAIGALRTTVVKIPPCSAAPNSLSSSASRSINIKKKSNSKSSSSSSSSSSGRAANIVSSPDKLPNAKVQSPLALLATQYLDNRSRSRSRARPAAETVKLSPVASSAPASGDVHSPPTPAYSTRTGAANSTSSFTITFALKLIGSMSKPSSVRTLRAVCAAELSVRPSQVTVNTVPSESNASAAAEVEVCVTELATAELAEAVTLRCRDPDALREGLFAAGFGDGTFTRKPKVQPPGHAVADAAEEEAVMMPTATTTTTTAASEAVPTLEVEALQNSSTAATTLDPLQTNADVDAEVVGGTLRNLGKETRSRSDSTTDSLAAENPLIAEADVSASSSTVAVDSPKLLSQAPPASGPPVVARPPSIRMRGTAGSSSLKASSSGSGGVKPRWIPRAALSGPSGTATTTTAKTTSKKSTATLSSPPSSPQPSAAAAVVAAVPAGLTLGRPMVARGSLPSPRGSASSMTSASSTSSSTQSDTTPNTAALRPRLLAYAKSRPNNSKTLDTECSDAQSSDTQSSDAQLANDGSEDGDSHGDNGNEEGVPDDVVSTSAAVKFPERASFDSMASSTMGLYAEALSASRVHQVQSESFDGEHAEVSMNEDVEDELDETDDVVDESEKGTDEASSTVSEVDDVDQDKSYANQSLDVEEMLQSMALASPQTSSFDGCCVISLADGDNEDEGGDDNEEDVRTVGQINSDEASKDGNGFSVSEADDSNDVEAKVVPESEESRATTGMMEEISVPALASHSRGADADGVLERTASNNEKSAVDSENTATNGNASAGDQEEKRRNDLKANARRLLMKNQLGIVKAHIAFQSPAAAVSTADEEMPDDKVALELEENQPNDCNAYSNEEPATTDEVAEQEHEPADSDGTAYEDEEKDDEGAVHALHADVGSDDGLSACAMPMDFSAAELRSAFNEQCSLLARTSTDDPSDEPSEVPSDQLNCAGFCALVQSLLKQRGFAANTSDLEAAFEAADVDQSGGVDVFEFVRLFDLVQAGLVHGFGQRRNSAASFSGNALVEQHGQEHKQEDVLGATATAEGNVSSSASEQELPTSTKEIESGRCGLFVEGDTVYWGKSDEDIPAGTSGRVLRVHHDGDVEVLFADAIFTFEASALRRLPLELSRGNFHDDNDANFVPKPMAVQKCSCVVS